MKKLAKYFLCVIACFFAMLLVVKTNVSANYDASKNYTKVSVNKDGVTVQITYQRGFESVGGSNSDSYTATYIWCESDENFSNFSSERCNEGTLVKFVDESGNKANSYIVKGASEYADSHPTTAKFTVAKEKDGILKNVGQVEGKYYILYVTTYFCTARDGLNQDGEYTSCYSYDLNRDKVITKLKITGNDLLNNSDDIGNDISNSELKGVMQKITDIAYNIILPVIWGLLGVFLVIKGSILGVQIVKAADEPQIRQEKLKSLKWLVIGVAIAYGATGVVKALERIIKNLVGAGGN